MLFNAILLFTGSKMLDLILAAGVVPFILGWIAAMAYYKVSFLRTRVTTLEGETTTLNGKVKELNTDLTELRVKMTQAEAEIHEKNARISRLYNETVVLEGERHTLQTRIDELSGKGGKTKTEPSTGGVKITPGKNTDPIMFNNVKYKHDDLQIVEGIGPKIDGLLRDAGIKTWKDLATAPTDRLREILDAAGPQFNIHDPATWAEQARLADMADWDALKKYQEELTAGRAS